MMSESTKQPTERELLIDQANLMGLEFAGNISTEKLKKLVAKELDPEAEKEKEVTPEVKPVGKAPKGYTEQELREQQQAIKVKQMTKLKRCIVTCNDPAMADWDTTPFLSISNSLITLPKLAVPLNVEYHVPTAYYEMLKEQQCSISIKTKDEKGRPITSRKKIKKYNIQDLPSLDAEELAELKQAQIMRDGIKS